MKKLLYIFVLFLMFPFIGKAATIEVVGVEAIINVKKNRTATVDENIDLYIIDKTTEFTKIFDTKYFAYRTDKSKVYIDSKISNINSDNLIDVNLAKKQETVKFKLDGKKDTIETVNLKYNYILGKDKAKNYDEFYYAIVNNDNVSSNISFEITLPKDLKINKVEYSINDKYNLSKDDVTYSIENNVITGYLNIMLNENQKFMVRIELPNNSFVNVKDNFNYLLYLYLLFPFITLVVIISYWFKYARGNKFKQVITNKVPNDFDPVEVSYLYKGFIDEKDLVVNLIFLANNGYLNIEENEDGYKLGTQNTFKFIKNMDYTKNNAIQKLLFEGIFKQKDIVELKDIEYGYSSKMINIKQMIDNKDNKLKIFNIDINKVKKISLLLLFVSILVLNIEPIKQLTDSYLLILVATALMSLGIAIMFIFNTKGMLKKILGFILCFSVVGISIYGLLGQTQLIIIYIMELVLIFLSIYIYKKIPNRTVFGNKKLAEINAFKMGLLSMTIKELEKRQKDNENYFYDMLLYTIVLGISNEWIAKGKKIIKKPPQWHITKEKFDLNNEFRFFKNVIFTTSKVMIKATYTKIESSQIEYKRFN